MDNANLLPENEYREEDSRRYINPNLPVTETEDFITKFRDTQRGNTQEISSQTEMLGTDVPSVEGGLTGAGSYWTSRYQAPQTNAVVQNLRATAQATALNEALANEQAYWKKKYNDAYRNYQKRQHDAAKRASYGGGGGFGGVRGGVEYEDTSNPEQTVGSVEPSYSPMGSGDYGYESNNLSGTFPTGGVLNPGNGILPSGNVNIQRDRFGNITSLSYDGHTFTGDAAKTRYEWLQSTGTITGKR